MIFIKVGSNGGIFLASQNNSDSPSLALARINLRFLSLFKQPKNDLLKDIHLVITFSGGELSLWQPQLNSWKCLETVIIQSANSSYNNLKTYAHHVLLIDALLEKGLAISGNKETLAQWLEEIADLQHDLTLLLCTHVPTCDEHQRKIAAPLFKESCLLLNNVVLSVNQYGELRKDDLTKMWEQYQSTVVIALQHIVELGALYQINALRKCMSGWMTAYHMNEIAKHIRIMLPVVHEPRTNYLEARYFCKLMQELTTEKDIENKYVYILEESPQFLGEIHKDIPGQLLSQLHRLEANKALGKRVFNNPNVMYSDILSSAKNIEEELNQPLLLK